MKTKFIYILLALILVLYFFLSTSLLLSYPYLNNDEAIMADISFNLLSEQRIGTDLWKGFLNGVENHAYWIPPFYFLVNAVWFKLVGFSAENFRLLSVTLGIGVVITFYLLTRTFLQHKSALNGSALVLATTLLLATDNTFIRASRTGRPEMTVLILTSIALIFFSKSLNDSLKLKKWPLILTGFFLGLACTTHLISVSFMLATSVTLLYKYRLKLFTFKNFYFYLLAFFTPPALWLISMYPNYNYLSEQLYLVSLSREMSISWFDTISKLSPVLVRINFSLYILITLLFISMTLATKNLRHIFLSLVMVNAWFFATLGKIYWYTVYPIPFIYLALAILIAQSFNKSGKDMSTILKKVALISMTAFLLLSNLYLYNTQLHENPPSSSYSVLREQVLREIPEGSTVYLSSFPDAYFILKEFNIQANPKPKYILYQWPVLKTQDENYLKVMSEIDYIVFDGNYTYSLSSGLLKKYIEQNQLNTAELSSPYKLKIIKLKPQTDRSPFK